MAKNNNPKKDVKGRKEDDRITSGLSDRRIERSPGGKPKPQPNSNKGGASTSRNNGSTSFAGVMAANINDISWYSDHPELLMDACNISFFNPLGTATHFARGAVVQGEDTAQFYPTVAGIMTFDVCPIPGWAAMPSDPVNVAADNIYAWVRHVNSGSKNYDPADYMMYILGVGFAYAWIGWLRRVYSELMVTSMQNRYMPTAVVESEGVSFEDLSGRITNFREYINLSQVKLGVLAYPAEIKLVNRWIHLFTNVFADSPNSKAQMYKFRPGGYYLYNETEGPGKLDWVSLDRPELMTLDDIMNITDDMISRLVKSEDIGVMSGDTIKAFGLEKLFNMEALTPENIVLPIFNPEMLDQIQNLTILASDVMSVDTNTFSITQRVDDVASGNYLLCMPHFISQVNSLAPYAWSTDKILNAENEGVLAPQVMIMTRLSAGSTVPKAADFNKVALNIVGSEIVLRGRVWHIDKFGRNIGTEMHGQYWAVMTSAFDLRRWIVFNHLRRAFDRHPVSFTFGELSEGLPGLLDIDLDLSNYTTVSCEIIGRMHTAAVMSLLNVPVVGTWSNKLK